MLAPLLLVPPVGRLRLRAGSGPVHRSAVDGVLGQPAHQVQALERELERGRGLPERLAALHLQPIHDLGQARHLADPAQQVGGGHQIARLDGATLGKSGQQAAEVGVAEQRPESVTGGPAQQVIKYLLLAALLADLELNFAAQGADDRWQITHPGDRILLAGQGGAPDGESTAGEARTSRVNLATTWVRCTGTTASGSVPPQAICDSCSIRASS